MIRHVRKRIMIAFTIFMVVLFIALAYWRWIYEDQINNGEFKPEDYHLATDNSGLNAKDVPALAQLNGEFGLIAQKVKNSIVSIRTAGVAAVKKFNRMDGVVTQQRMAVTGLGSGVIVSSQGHIITNQHVINGKRAIRVTLANGKDYSAYLVGEDKLLDIAVLRIESKDRFEALPLGDSDHVQTGQIVMAFGNPYGYNASMTQGIVSGRDRRRDSLLGTDWIQTDAAIHPGSSGGPLVNIYGEIIGINTAQEAGDAVQNEGGFGFAIPSNVVREAFQQICRYGHPIRGYHGIDFIDNTPDLSSYLAYNQSDGALVNAVQLGSPAQKAGLRRGDLVIRINGEKVKNALDVAQKAEKMNIDDVLDLLVISKGEEKQVRMKLMDIQNEGIMPYPSLELLKNMGLGIREFNLVEISRGAYGVLVVDVNPESQAGSVFRKGDLIYAADNEPLAGLGDLDAKLMRGKAILSVARQTERFNVNVNLKL